MKLSQEIIKKIEEKGITVECLTHNPSFGYKLSIKSPRGCSHSYHLNEHFSFVEAVSEIKRVYKAFSLDNYACRMYNYGTRDENDKPLSLADCVKEARFVKNDFYRVLRDVFGAVKQTEEDLFKEKIAMGSAQLRTHFDSRCNSRRGLINDCGPLDCYFLDNFEGNITTEEIFTNYLHWLYVFEFLENAKLTEEQLNFFNEQRDNAAKLIVDATNASMQALKEEFINKIAPDALTTLMNNQSDESAGDNNG